VIHDDNSGRLVAMLNSTSSFRREAAVVGAMTLVGAVLRFWQMGHLGLNHFDEGIYAMAAIWQPAQGFTSFSTELISYAPPLYPMLVRIMYLFLGVSDVSAILVSLISGVLTIPAVAWVARRTFGPGAGAAAAALCAIAGPHICFSRMALTDSTFLLCWILALGLGGRFLERPNVWRAIPFGLMVGLAQNTKYNGYLAGGIVAVTVFWGLIVPSQQGRAGAVKAISYGLIAALIAMLVYWPWYGFVESHPGGYAGLIKHHRGYLHGLDAWPGFWHLQMGQSYGLSGELVEGLTWGIIAWPLAWLGGTFAATQGVVRSRRRQMRMRLGFVLGAAVLGVAPNAGWWVALALMPWWILDKSVAKRLIGIGWLTMAILTPFYHPYARLWLPLHAFGWLALASLVIDPDWDGEAEAVRKSWSSRLQTLALVGAVMAAVFSDAKFEPRARSLGSPIGPTDGMRLEIAKLAAWKNPMNPNPGRLLLFVRPPVIFYLKSQLDRPIVRLGDPESLVQTAQNRDEGVIDYQMLDSSKPVPERFLQLMNRGHSTGRSMSFIFSLPPTTRADQNPSAVFDRQMTNQEGLNFIPIVVP
jgi:dolichyl-phosphate-mannose-protein mannosyltransferase